MRLMAMILLGFPVGMAAFSIGFAGVGAYRKLNRYYY
jgi:hypothetical protein